MKRLLLTLCLLLVAGTASSHSSLPDGAEQPPRRRSLVDVLADDGSAADVQVASLRHTRRPLPMAGGRDPGHWLYRPEIYAVVRRTESVLPVPERRVGCESA